MASSPADLRGASADALQAVSGRVAGLSGEEAGRVGEDLFAVAGLLRAEPSLRRVVTEVSTDARAKADLARGVLAGKVSEPALDVVAQAVQQRWTRSRDLADALEHLGVEAVVRSDDGSDGLADELFAVRRVVVGDADLRNALGDPSRSAADRVALLDGLIADRTRPATRALARQALSSSHRTVSLALEAFERVAAEVHDQRVATVRVAQPLSQPELERLHEALRRSYGREIHLDVLLDPTVLGGIRVELGDDVIDGTVSARLDEAHRLLAG